MKTKINLKFKIDKPILEIGFEKVAQQNGWKEEKTMLLWSARFEKRMLFWRSQSCLQEICFGILNILIEFTVLWLFY